MEKPSIDRKMKIYYHGTTDDNLHSIMKNGLKIGSYLAVGLQDALGYGGNVVIEVALFEDGFANGPPKLLPHEWQFKTDGVIPSDNFVRIKKYGDAYTIHENRILRDTVLWSNLDKDQRESNNRVGTFFDYARGVVDEEKA